VTPTGVQGELHTSEFTATAVAEARGMLAAQAESATRTIAGKSVFIDVYRVPPQLVIVSAGNDTRPLARFAVEVGFRVVVVDRRPALLLPDRFPDGAALIEAPAADLARAVDFDRNTFVVLMTHNFADDQDYLRAIVATPAPYIGMLGPRQRTERILRTVSAEMPFDAERLFGPVGLDVGTDGAEQVAIAIVAEMLAVRAGRRPQSLRDRVASIHALMS
jgi:xanthine dehydrogenase accessory factor